MKRTWFVVLALSIGLNAGLLYVLLTGPDTPPPPWQERERIPRGPGRMDDPGSGRGSQDGPGQGAESEEPDRLERILQGRMEMMTRHLELSPEQRTEIEAILNETLPLILKEQREVWEVRRAMRSRYEGGEFNPDQIQADLRRMHSAQARLDSLVVLSLTKEAQVLSPEQRARYLESMPWHHPMDSGRGFGHQGRGKMRGRQPEEPQRGPEPEEP